MNKVYVVGIGPGKPDGMTVEAVRALEQCSIIIGYPVYVDQVRAYFPGKTCLSTPMRQEVRRCRIALAAAEAGNTVAMVCSGDAGVYGMAGLLYELRGEYPGASITVIPGVTAALSGAALLGAPLGHDFCVISLSDLLTPWPVIEKRIRMAAQADFAVCIYNPSSHKRKDHLQKACDLMLQYRPSDTICGIAENIGREGETMEILSLSELRNREVNMFTTVFIGNASTKIIDGKMVTPRGYLEKEQKTDTKQAGE